ncbi:MAG: hypothetical protein ACHQU1_05805 [Gemmatimonadales bacterium]
MSARVVHFLAATALAGLATPARAQQQPPAVRPLGPITNVSHDTLSAVAAAVQVAGGRVYVNDISARRVLLYDSTLANMTVVADSASGGANAYGSRPGTLLPFHGDSALFITPSALSMLVLSPTGAITRTMAMPPSGGGGLPALLGNIFGTPGFDAHGRLAYYSPVRIQFRGPPPTSGAGFLMEPPDSAFVVRFDFATRTLDTAAIIHIAHSRTNIQRDDQGKMNITITAYPPMTVDDWAVTSDGAIAVVRGRDYHVDRLNEDGSWTSAPRLAYAWERMNDSTKSALIDSTATAMQTVMDSMPARMQRATGAGAAAAGGAAVVAGDRAPAGGGGGGTFQMTIVGPGGGDGRAGGGGGGGGPTTVTMSAPKVVKAEVADVPDYRPVFRQGAVRADLEGNLWIRTNKMVDARPVYDIVNRDGQVTDRVQLPQFRTIAGFGPGVVYMAVRDSSGTTHLERARVR